MLILFLLATNLWLQSQSKAGTDVPLAALQAAYARVVPGETPASELAQLGFDTGRAGVRRLSYLGLMERFAPGDSAAFDRLDPEARKCLQTPEGCSAYLFRLRRAGGSGGEASFGFVSAAEAEVPGVVELLFLIHDGRVIYKAMQGV
ncbi:MAG: hypothetical protein JO256_07320 [Alphaproteobacteria bacterium]|nr:hypothetical protein [Alphaproteobacteria bacterium]